MTIEKTIPLGKTDIKISPIGFGTMEWSGITATNQLGKNVDEITKDIFRINIAAGVNFFDTAEMYGRGKSEIYLGKCIKESSENIVIASKFMPYPWRLSKGEMRSALLKSLKRMGVTRVDLYQMHWPIPPVPIKNWMDAMADLFSDGLIRAVGVSNYSPHLTEIAFEALDRHHLPLASNQVRYSILHRNPERNGLAELCKKLGVTIIAYTPLEKGILTGRYNSANLPAGYLAWRYNKAYLAKIEPLLELLSEIGKAHDNRSPAQVELNWLLCKGAVPIPGASDEAHALENIGSLGWQLSTEEVARLDKVSEEVTM